ncbi:MAG: VOC family protein [Acidobacteria bacterium]|nr:VOC family protein [Acidobacteriota bacterium]MBV9146930.1 VOC family protein [Acidobacteriota bacterium]MBV9434597.1 VOC family protein [Acidobacteriota bacterium]
MSSASIAKTTRPFLSQIIGFAMTAKPDAAKRFYGETLRFRFVKDDGFALVFDAHGTMLRIAKAKEVKPAPYTILGWQVDDIAEAVKTLSARGVVFERYPGMSQDKHGIWNSGGGYVAWFKDPDGNVLSVSQHN